MLAPPHSAPELVELGEPEPLRPLYQHHRGVGDVYSHLHHRGGDQHVVLPVLEVQHYPVLFGRPHPAVEKGKPQPGQISLLQPLVLGRGSPHLQVGAVLHQGADDERLPARWPPRAGYARRRELRSSGPSRWVLTFCRPGGISSMMERSRSPYRVSARVRGMGVAVITSRWGVPPFSLRAVRWASPRSGAARR